MRKIKYVPFEFGDQQLKMHFIKAFEDFLESKQYILGGHVREFEKNWAEYCQTKYAIGVGNGYDALFISLKVLGIGSDDEVIVPAHTFAATALAVLNSGATPVLVDAHPTTFNIDVSKIEEKLNKKTKAIVAVHLYGNPCDMDPIKALCEKHKLHLIEDNAQAQGARYKRKVTGGFGDVSATSFYPVKNLGAMGDAGAINTDSLEINEKVRLLRSYGSPDKHEMLLQGVNSRLDELQAVFLNIKLNFLDDWNDKRKGIAELYRKNLNEISELQLCDQPVDIQSANHIFPILTDKKNQLRKYLTKNEIQTLQHYPIPYHLEKTFRRLDHQKGDFPVTEKICAQEISLPIFPGLTEEDVVYICDTIKQFFKSQSS